MLEDKRTGGARDVFLLGMGGDETEDNDVTRTREYTRHRLSPILLLCTALYENDYSIIESSL